MPNLPPKISLSNTNVEWFHQFISPTFALYNTEEFHYSAQQHYEHNTTSFVLLLTSLGDHSDVADQDWKGMEQVTRNLVEDLQNYDHYGSRDL